MDGHKILLEDIPGGEHLAIEHGKLFSNWYLFKNFLRRMSIPLDYNGQQLLHEFKVYDYRCRFIMPSVLEYAGNIITYDESERLFGMFRFPQDKNGRFTMPVRKSPEEYLSMSTEQLQELIRNRKVMVFEAFRIPQHGFEFIDVDENDLEQIEARSGANFRNSVRQQFGNELDSRMCDILQRIKSSPNYLLILRDSLRLKSKNFDNVAKATNNIIHIE